MNIGHTANLRHFEEIATVREFICSFYAKLEMQFLSSEVLLLIIPAFIGKRGLKNCY